MTVKFKIEKLILIPLLIIIITHFLSIKLHNQVRKELKKKTKHSGFITKVRKSKVRESCSLALLK